jgi:hypothetical protein
LLLALNLIQHNLSACERKGGRLGYTCLADDATRASVRENVRNIHMDALRREDQILIGINGFE